MQEATYYATGYILCNRQHVTHTAIEAACDAYICRACLSQQLPARLYYVTHASTCQLTNVAYNA